MNASEAAKNKLANIYSQQITDEVMKAAIGSIGFKHSRAGAKPWWNKKCKFYITECRSAHRKFYRWKKRNRRYRNMWNKMRRYKELETDYKFTLNKKRKS